MKTIQITSEENPVIFDKENNMFVSEINTLIEHSICNFDDSGFFPFEHINREFLLQNMSKRTSFVFAFHKKHDNEYGVCYEYRIKNAPRNLKDLSMVIFA